MIREFGQSNQSEIRSSLMHGGDRRSWGILSGRFLRGRVDPHCPWQISRVRQSLHEALGMRRVGRREHVLPLLAHRGRHFVVDDW